MFVFGLKVCQLLVGGSVGGDGVVGSGDKRGVWRGDVWCRYV